MLVFLIQTLKSVQIMHDDLTNGFNLNSYKLLTCDVDNDRTSKSITN